MGRGEERREAVNKEPINILKLLKMCLFIVYKYFQLSCYRYTNCITSNLEFDSFNHGKHFDYYYHIWKQLIIQTLSH